MPTNITTACYPGFMTDWQGPWTLLMTQADGTSTVHETIYENRFGYIGQLKKMGANISFFNPKVNNPEKFYNFNWENNSQGSFHAINIHGPTPLCSSNLVIPDLRAGATLVLAALGAKGRSTLTGIEHIDRGYEHFENRLQKLGAKIQRKEI
jgi:UDP-N-acetylglucosamine 1-carboxyvinyltransferase